MKKKKRILIVVADFYPDLAKELLKGATTELKKSGVEYSVVEVPGALEIPAAIAFAGKKYDGYVALGAVIRGETGHYDIVCNESARGLSELALTKKLAIANGILTVENLAQAKERASVKGGNKGGFAAKTVLQMMQIKEKFK